MTNEVFNNPTVVEVDYEVRFPPLFYINQKIGDFQLEILDEFPKSSQQVLSSVTFDAEGIAVKDETNKPVLNWVFEDSNGKTKIIVKLDRLIINSMQYKSYDSHPTDKFRDVISQVVGKFRKHVPIKRFNRIGLRYVDRCPLDDFTNNGFCRFYNPVIDINKFKVENLIESLVRIRTKKPPYYLLFQSGIEYAQYHVDIDLNQANIVKL